MPQRQRAEPVPRITRAGRKPKPEAADDRRCAEAIYRLGLATGMNLRRTVRERRLRTERECGLTRRERS
jgi:hypothetical protein